MKAAVEHVREEYAFSQRRACGLLMVAVSSFRYQTEAQMKTCGRGWWSWPERSLASAIGDCRCCCAARESSVNHKRVHRVYREAGLACGGRSVNTASGRCPLRGTRRRTRNGRWISCTMRSRQVERSGC